MSSERAVQQFLDNRRGFSSPCCCLGPQNGEPLCPCEMAWVVTVYGQSFQITETRTPTGYNYTATQLKVKAPVVTEQERQLSLKERLQKKYGRA